MKKVIKIQFHKTIIQERHSQNPELKRRKRKGNGNGELGIYIGREEIKYQIKF